MRRVASVALAAAVSGLFLAASPSPASAQLSFFGEDFFGFPSSSGVVSRATVFPNASAARADFLSNLSSSVGTEDFESGFTHNQPAPIGLSFPGAGTATLSGAGVVRDWTVPGEWRGNDRYPTSGDFFYDVPAGDFTVTFSSPVAAFGFYGVDVGDVGESLFLQVVRASGSVEAIDVPHAVTHNQVESGRVLFYGLIDKNDPLTSVEFKTGSGPDLFAFDDMTIASPQQVVPEPATVVLLGTGLVGLGLAARRRRGDGGRDTGTEGES